MDGSSNTVGISETIISDGVPGHWDGVTPTNGFVLALNGDDLVYGPQLINYPADCSGAGLKLNMTRGVIWIYGAPGHSMYNHGAPPTIAALIVAADCPTAVTPIIGGTSFRTTSPPGAATSEESTRCSVMARSPSLRTPSR